MQRPENTISYRRLVDLSHPIRPGIPQWPGDPAVRFDTVAKLDQQGYFLRSFSMGEHTGTHLSSPAAYYADGAGPEAMPAASLLAPAVVIDVSRQSAADPDYALSVADIAEWEQRHKTIAPGVAVLLFTGWQRFWGHPERFINLDAHGVMHTPGFSMAAAQLLLNDRRVHGLATDAPGIDRGVDAGLSISRLALSQASLVLECVNNLDQLPPIGTTIVVGRLMLVGGSGSPAAVLALAP